MLILELAQCQEACKDSKVLSHFFKVINTHVWIEEFIELFDTMFKRLEFNIFGHFDIFDNTISDVGFEFSCIANTETVPVDDFDLEDMTID